MKQIKTISIVLCLTFQAFVACADSALASGGKLKLVGNQLSSECGMPIQLRGMSSHGIHWFSNCYTSQSLDTLVQDWGIDVFRIVAYVAETSSGYKTNPATFRSKIDQLVDLCEEKGVYCIIDWHILSDGNPLENMEDAKEFWEYMSKTHSGKKHVLYEICNEPNRNTDNTEVPWSDIKTYAETIIPIIRNNDPETIIVVGTPSWSGNPWNVVGDELTGDNAYNVMYTFHFYAGSHASKKTSFKNVLSKIPVFVTEWGTSDASGNDGFNESETRNWIDIFNGNNDEGVKISWVNWSFADKDETSAALAPGACRTKNFNSTSESGTLVKELLNTPADAFIPCSTEPQLISDLKDVVIDEGMDASFKINVTGLELEYTWFLNGDTIPNENSNVLELLSVSSGLDGGIYAVHIKNAEGGVQSRDALLTVRSFGPFNGEPLKLPGIIQAEEYDIGIKGETYLDKTNGNTGGEFRDDDVDISASGDVDDGYAVGWVDGGEWLEYTVDIDETTEYAFTFRTANEGTYGLGRVSVAIDGNDVITSTEIKATGGWVTWEDTEIRNVSLIGGEHTLRMSFEAGPLNVNYIKVQKENELPLFLGTTSTEIKISPNPVENKVNISGVNSGKVVVLDVFGSPISNELRLSDQSSIDVSKLTPGLYMLQIEVEGRSQYVKWIKN